MQSPPAWAKSRKAHAGGLCLYSHTLLGCRVRAKVLLLSKDAFSTSESVFDCSHMKTYILKLFS